MNKKAKELMKNLRNKYSYRDLKIGQYSKAYDKCETHRCEGQVRKLLSHAESGRYRKMLDETHDFITALDKDERKKFAGRNSCLFKRVQEFGKVEDLDKFSNINVECTE